ncbi:UNVERIFIED_CONTAM: hypothetical protein Slati_1329900 [Sesamum latifolium]|uniref:Helitron helicase-like domain-containing protein n=1 Tax=Sesamum latifolium TaxID=2727402 RepID=A0AAW2XIQ9_9LAMI
MARDRFRESDYVPVWLRFIGTRKKDERQYNLPTTSEVVALIVGDGQQSRGTRDIVIEERGRGLQRITELHPSSMAMQYPLLFSYGEDDFRTDITRNPRSQNSLQPKSRRQFISLREYHAYRYYGPPDIFLTFTCNPKWSEIQKFVDLIPDQKVEDRIDVVASVFKIKLDELMKDLCQGQHLVGCWPGKDRATFVIKENVSIDGVTKSTIVNEVDEIKRYLDARYVSASEVSWRIFEFDIQYRSPGVERLSFHLPDEQNVIFGNDDQLDDVLNKEGIEKTMFTEWMQMNKVDPSARELTYADFPTKFVWHAKEKKWKKKKKRKSGRCIGRIYYAHPSSREIFYLRMLLNIVKGPRCHDDIKTVNGTLYPTYKEVCNAFGLLGNEGE